jgi:hypothetical protein
MRHLLVLAFCCVVAPVASANSFDRTGLIGKWDCTSLTNLQDGRPFGTVHFNPGVMSYTYSDDGTWVMEAQISKHTKLNGRYEIHGSELVMRNADGSLYEDFKVEIKDKGKEVVFKAKSSIITASKVETIP